MRRSAWRRGGAWWAAWCAAALALAACGEDPGNRPPGERVTDQRAWEAPKNGYVAPGWTSGDQGSWDEHMRKRAQAQNEYTRVGS